MRAIAVLLPLLMLAACQTPCPAASEPVTMTLACEDGSALRVTFAPEQAVVLQEGYTPLTLPARVAGAGYRYAGDGAELRGRPTESRWTRPGAAETLCRQSE